MDILKTFVITACLFAAISGCAHDFINRTSSDIPEFESLAGTGTLAVSETTLASESFNASLYINENYTVEGIGNCKAFTISTPVEAILSVALCADDSKYVFCGSRLNNCVSDFKTKRSGSSLSLIRDLGFGDDETRFLIEFLPNKIIYRIQGETCLIGYPHGCIIDGFSWVDEYTYTYVYKS